MTPDEFTRTIVAAAAGRDRILVGIAGAPGAGKSTLAATVAASLGPDAAVLPMDGFHLPQARLAELGRRDRMGAPDTFDVAAFVTALESLRFSGALVDAPAFDREIEEPRPHGIRISPEKRVVIVEGNYLLHDRDGWERVASLLDLTAFLTENEELRRERLIARHIAYGKDPDAARAWVLGPDERNAVLVAATATRADVIVELD